jgi:hypothetical protein
MNKIGRLSYRSEEVRNAEETYLTLLSKLDWQEIILCIALQRKLGRYRSREYLMIYRGPSFLAVV